MCFSWYRCQVEWRYHLPHSGQVKQALQASLSWSQSESEDLTDHPAAAPVTTVITVQCLSREYNALRWQMKHACILVSPAPHGGAQGDLGTDLKVRGTFLELA